MGCLEQLKEIIMETKTKETKEGSDELAAALKVALPAARKVAKLRKTREAAEEQAGR